MKQLKISLPDDLRARLDAAVSKSGLSLAEEIRQRIDRTLEDDEAERDPLTEILVDDIRRLAEEVTVHAGVPWHSDAKAHEALQFAVQIYLAADRDRVLKASPSSLDLDPATLGRAIFQNWTRFVEMRRAWDEISAAPVESREDVERLNRDIAEFTKRFGRSPWGKR